MPPRPSTRSSRKPANSDPGPNPDGEACMPSGSSLRRCPCRLADRRARRRDGDRPGAAVRPEADCAIRRIDRVWTLGARPGDNGRPPRDDDRLMGLGHSERVNGRASGNGSAPNGSPFPPVVRTKVRIPSAPSMPSSNSTASSTSSGGTGSHWSSRPPVPARPRCSARFAARAPGPVGWYRAEPWDRDEAALLRHLEAALVPSLKRRCRVTGRRSLMRRTRSMRGQASRSCWWSTTSTPSRARPPRPPSNGWSSTRRRR